MGNEYIDEFKHPGLIIKHKKDFSKDGTVVVIGFDMVILQNVMLKTDSSYKTVKLELDMLKKDYEWLWLTLQTVTNLLNLVNWETFPSSNIGR